MGRFSYKSEMISNLLHDEQPRVLDKQDPGRTVKFDPKIQ